MTRSHVVTVYASSSARAALIAQQAALVDPDAVVHVTTRGTQPYLDSTLTGPIHTAPPFVGGRPQLARGQERVLLRVGPFERVERYFDHGRDGAGTAVFWRRRR